ncbi:MAG: flagellar hook capping FlgD N-terminal domain-containing protein [Deltaproteobacteria bacterium]
MSVDAITSASLTTASDTTAATSATDTVGKDDFLLLLVTQLQNQDPLDPMDNTEFVAQLAQFSTLEGITNLGTSMEDVADNISTMQSFSTSGLVGRSVKIEGDSFEYNGEDVLLGYTLASDAQSVMISIYDSTGALVRGIDAGAASYGDYEGGWDGTDDYGDALDEGTYSYYVNAKDANGNSVDVTTYVTGTVGSVSLSNGAASINVGEETVAQEDIKEIY